MPSDERVRQVRAALEAFMSRLAHLVVMSFPLEESGAAKEGMRKSSVDSGGYSSASDEPPHGSVLEHANRPTD